MSRICLRYTKDITPGAYQNLAFQAALLRSNHERTKREQRERKGNATSTARENQPLPIKSQEGRTIFSKLSEDLKMERSKDEARRNRRRTIENRGIIQRGIKEKGGKR